MPDRFYSYAGLTIRSELPIVEWDSFEIPPSPHDVAVRALPEQPLGDDPRWIARTGAGDGAWRQDVANVASFIVTDSEIAVTPCPGAEMDTVRVFLLGSAWGILCYLRGIAILHASVVRVGDGAVAFCGESGAGKSSLAAWLISRGHGLICDDLCRVEIPDTGPVLVHRSAPKVKLWRDAIEEIGWSPDGCRRDHARMDKFHMPVAADVDERVPLRAINVLTWGDLKRTRLTGSSALRRLVAAATYRGEVVDELGGLAAQWETLASIAERTPIYELSRPRDWSAMASAAALLVGDS